MSVSIDTNIIVYVLTGTVKTMSLASRTLAEAAQIGGRLDLAAPVYAELLALPDRKKAELDEF